MPLKTKKRTFVIDRAIWLNGEAQDMFDVPSKLLEPVTGFMCCLGQVCQQFGFSKASLHNRFTPSDLGHKELREIGLINKTGEDSRFAWAAMKINDSKQPHYRGEKREAALIRLAARHGVTLRFKGRFPTKKEAK